MNLSKNKTIKLIIAEVSLPATGQGIELGYAHAFQTPVLMLAKQDAKVSGSLVSLFPNLFRYSATEEWVDFLKANLN